jgi:predicted nucleotidyltransferase
MKSQNNSDLIDYIVALARQYLYPSRIILFGSRARGDARPKSDYDFAFEFDAKKSGSNWSTFSIEAQENAPTLLPMDLVNMNEISDEFMSKIHQEGIVVYQEKINE